MTDMAEQDVLNQPRLRVGQYLVYPGQGLSVISARRLYHVDKIKTVMLEARPLHDLQTLSAIAEELAGDRGLRPPSSHEDIKAALEKIAQAPGYPGKGERRRPSNDYKPQFASGRLEDLVTVLCDLARSYKGRVQGMDNIPPLDRRDAQRAIKLLAVEMAFDTGLTIDKCEKHIDKLLFGRIKNGDKKDDYFWPKKTRKRHPPVMDREEFHALFHQYPEQEEQAAPKVFSALREIYEPRRRFGRTSGGDAREDAGGSDSADTEGEDEKKTAAPSKSKIILSKRGRSARAAEAEAPAPRRNEDRQETPQKNGGRPDDKDVHEIMCRELSMKCGRGCMSNIFRAAVEVLDAPALDVYTRLETRRPEFRQTLAQVAEDLGKMPQEVIAMRNEAVHAMRAHLCKGNRADFYRNMRCLALWAADDEGRGAQEAGEIISASRKKIKKELLSSTGDMIAPLYKRERDLVPARGPVRGLFLRAVKALSAEKFDVYTRLETRTPAHRETLAQVADSLGKSEDEVRRIRNEAVRTLRQDFIVCGDKIPHMAAIELMLNGEDTPPDSPAAAMDDPVSKEGAEEFQAEREGVPLAALAAVAAVDDPAGGEEAVPPEEEPALDEDMRVLYERERALAVSEGPLKGFLNLAAGLLTPEEFDVYARMEIRRPECRETPAQIARVLGKSEDEVRLIRDEAASLIRDWLEAEGQEAALLPAVLPLPAEDAASEEDTVEVVLKLPVHRVPGTRLLIQFDYATDGRLTDARIEEHAPSAFPKPAAPV